MKAFHGFRNFTLGVVYLGCCMWLAKMHQFSIDGSISEMGPTFISLGAGVTGVVAGRAVNKWAERTNGKTNV